MTVEEAILSHDMEDIINRMILYAKEKIKLLDIKNLQGKEPFDFVQDILCKSLESKRNWDETKCSFVEFLFGCLKSEISNFYSSKQIFHQDKERREIFLSYALFNLIFAVKLNDSMKPLSIYNLSSC